MKKKGNKNKAWKKYLKDNPWAKTLVYIQSRCNYKKHSYFLRGIKNYLKVEDLKFLWFRDRAWEMKSPSIDRIDGSGGYTLDNCRYIEYTENMRRKKPELCKKVFQLDNENRIIASWKSVSAASLETGRAIGGISECINGKRKTISGLRFIGTNTVEGRKK